MNLTKEIIGGVKRPNNPDEPEISQYIQYTNIKLYTIGIHFIIFEYSCFLNVMHHTNSNNTKAIITYLPPTEGIAIVKLANTRNTNKQIYNFEYSSFTFNLKYSKIAIKTNRNVEMI